MGVAINLTINRLPRDGDFTMIPNSILRDSTLSCKAKAVLMYLIGERDNSYTPADEKDVWVMTIKGLTAAFKESIGAIKRSLDELMLRGYLVRTDILNERHLRIRSEYTVYEKPIENPDGKPLRRYEVTQNTQKVESEQNVNKEESPTEIESVEREACEAVLKNNIDFDTLAAEYGYDNADRVVRIMSKSINKHRLYWIGRKPVKTDALARRLYNLDYDDVARVIEKVNEQSHIQNWDKYVLTSLYRAGETATQKSYGSTVLCVALMQHMITAYKNNNLVAWWNENRSDFSEREFNVARQFVRDKYKWDKSAYEHIIADLTDYDSFI